MNKRNFVPGLLAAVAVLGASGVAAAGINYPTKLSMHYSRSSGGQFAGAVNSSNACTSNRRVVVYRKSPGRDGSIGSAKSSSGGHWHLRTGKPRSGNYYAQTNPKSAGAGVRCGGARSATTHVS